MKCIFSYFQKDNTSIMLIGIKAYGYLSFESHLDHPLVRVEKSVDHIRELLHNSIAQISNMVVKLILVQKSKNHKLFSKVQYAIKNSNFINHIAQYQFFKI